MSEEKFRKLKGIYTSLTNAAAFGSAENLRKASGLSKKEVSTLVKNILKNQACYTKVQTIKG